MEEVDIKSPAILKYPASDTSDDPRDELLSPSPSSPSSFLEASEPETPLATSPAKTRSGPPALTSLTDKIANFLQQEQPVTPCVVIDVDIVERGYKTLRRVLPLASVFYAVKACPARPVLDRLIALGSSFDTASPNEIDFVLKAGASPDRISFGNTIKKSVDIRYAYAKGVRMFAFDSEAELYKLAQDAPGSKVYCRILVECSGAEWPLSRKFGCQPEMAEDLLYKAQQLGLHPYGISFHVGSQQTNLASWDIAVSAAADLFQKLSAKGVHLDMLNLGGGFPAHYRANVRPVEDYASAVMGSMVKHFGSNLPEMLIEPGRSIMGDAGVIQTEVVLVSKKSESDEKRWVYLDCGKFNGLPETMDESIKYNILTPHDGKEVGPVIIAGPTCDSADIMYEKTPYNLPMDLAAGDKVVILSCGAYTSTYASVCFNGFDPIRTFCV